METKTETEESDIDKLKKCLNELGIEFHVDISKHECYKDYSFIQLINNKPRLTKFGEPREHHKFGFHEGKLLFHPGQPIEEIENDQSR